MKYKVISNLLLFYYKKMKKKQYVCHQPDGIWFMMPYEPQNLWAIFKIWKQTDGADIVEFAMIKIKDYTFLPGNPKKSQRQTMQTQIRRHIMWRLTRVYIVW